MDSLGMSNIIANQEDQTTADKKKRKQQQKLPSTLNKWTYYSWKLS